MNNETPTQPVAAEPAKPGATGPRTEAGKAISSQNARKHDLCSRTLHLTTDEWAEYNDMRARYGRELQPADDVEETLVDEICFNYWRLQQAREAELTIIEGHPTELRIISLYIRYRTGYERSFYKGLDQIQKRQNERRKQATQRAPVRSAESSSPPPSANPKLAAESVPTLQLEPLRSEDPISSAAAALKEELDDHHLENRVRSELCLPPLPMPAELSRRVKDFVSQNPRHSHLAQLLAKAV